MTVSSIEVVKDYVDEMQGQGLTVGSVWAYTHSLIKRKLFTVFTTEQYCDIHERYNVENLELIWRDGLWIGEFEYLNQID